MRSLLRPYSGLLSGAFFLMVGVGVAGSLIPWRLGEAETSDPMIGVVGGAYFTGLILGSLCVNRLIAVVGHIRAFAALGSLFSAALVLHPLALSLPLWITLRFVEGLTLAGLFMCLESWLNAQATDTTRGTILSLYMIVVYAGQSAGQFLLWLPDPTQFALFVLASVCVSIAVVPVAVTRLRAPPPPSPQRMGPVRLYVVSPVGMAGAIVSGLVLGAFYALAPLFAQQSGLSLHGTSAFMALAILGGLALQWPLGRLSDRFDRRIVLIWIATGIAVTAIGVLIADRWGAIGLWSVAPVLGAMIFTLYPVSVAHANDRLDTTEAVALSGGLITAYGIGAALGPLVGSMAIEVIGAAGLFLFIACNGLAMGLFGLWRVTRRTAPAMEEHAAFRLVPRTTPMASELDPRLHISTDEIPNETVETSES